VYKNGYLGDPVLCGLTSRRLNIYNGVQASFSLGCIAAPAQRLRLSCKPI
jgi:hypothetical protein